MSRIRTHNNRRRAKELKQSGLYTMRYSKSGISWAERDLSPSEIASEIRGALTFDVVDCYAMKFR